MTDRERAENIAKNIDTMAEESFREWSSHRLHERIKTHANSIILDYLLGDFQTLAALGATRNDEPRQSAPLPELRPRGNRPRIAAIAQAPPRSLSRPSRSNEDAAVVRDMRLVEHASSREVMLERAAKALRN
jgi:hypothetical protein